MLKNGYVHLTTSNDFANEIALKSNCKDSETISSFWGNGIIMNQNLLCCVNIHLSLADKKIHESTL